MSYRFIFVILALHVPGWCMHFKVINAAGQLKTFLSTHKMHSIFTRTWDKINVIRRDNEELKKSCETEKSGRSLRQKTRTTRIALNVWKFMHEHACSSVTVFYSFWLRVRTPPPNARFALVLFTRVNAIPRTVEIKEDFLVSISPSQIRPMTVASIIAAYIIIV